MKQILLLLMGLLIICTSQAQNDTMYIMRSGGIFGKHKVSEVDSVIFYKPPKMTFTDSRDGNVYQAVKIGNQVWMAENLKYLPAVVGASTGSKTTAYYYVYNYNGTDVNSAKSTSSYNKYGVLYNWTAAMNGAGSSNANPSGIQGVCPVGWHLPSSPEFLELMNFLGDGSGTHLRAESGWLQEGNGTDNYGFTALPGGIRYYQGMFLYEGSKGYFWSATEDDIAYIEDWSTAYGLEYNSSYLIQYPTYRETGYSVRCVRD